MRIEVVKSIDAETREVWTFNMFDLLVVFVGFKTEKKPKGKRIWVCNEYWDNYDKRNSKLTEPVLPDEIKKDALNLAISYIKVKTWNEYKK